MTPATHGPRRRETDASILATLVNLFTFGRVVFAMVAGLAGALLAVHKMIADLDTVKVTQQQILKDQQGYKHSTDSLLTKYHGDNVLLKDLVASLSRLECNKAPAQSVNAGLPCAALSLPLPDR